MSSPREAANGFMAKRRLMACKWSKVIGSGLGFWSGSLLEAKLQIAPLRTPELVWCARFCLHCTAPMFALADGSW
jgi:hypothetical protein